jgi:alkanesulfonate monooxygenase SsuD/methylene tetrahydromethanopterin reductase-like flavin-dependent oxidoreductase (luciferase family)
VPFPSVPERAQRLEEGIQVLRLLMTTDDATFEGRHYRVDHATYRPRAVQQPHPPFWVGAGGERLTIPIAARHADVWHGFGPVETLRRKALILDDHAKRAGRDPASIARASSLSISESWDEVLGRAVALRELGFSYLEVSWPTEGWARLEEFVQKVMPELVD